MKKPPLPLSKEGQELMTRIIVESDPLLRKIIAARSSPTLEDKINLGDKIYVAEFLAGLTVGVGVALSWLEEHEQQ